MSELPKAPWKYDGDPPWQNDPLVREHRDVLVPDTLEWSGRRPFGETWKHEPVPFTSPNGWELRLGCWDKPKGRVLSTSTCTALETPILPFADHAWDYLEIAEAATEEYLRRGWQIARVDFARDLRVPGSRGLLKEWCRASVRSGYEVEVHLKDRQLGFTALGVAGGDRLRIYHKGLEAWKKFGERRMDPRLADVIRVELQLRKGQLDDSQRKNVHALRTARIKPEPREDDVPVMRLKPSFGRRIGRRHLHGMKRGWLPRRAVEATEAVDAFLVEQGLDMLLPGQFGVELPDPLYGETPQHRAKR